MGKNRYKNKSKKPFRINFISKPVIVLALLCLTSLALLFAYDFTMQSTYFNVKKIHIDGNYRVKSQEIIKLAKIRKNNNILSLNLALLEKRIINHPWIQKASIKRSIPSELLIKINEETPLAIVRIEDIAEILINSNGKPFKEYEAGPDKLGDLPVITGLELTESKGDFLFKGILFDSVIKVLEMKSFGRIHLVNADKNMGISISTKHFNHDISMKLGFHDFHSKASKAEKIATYFKNYITNKEICAFDLYDPENVLVKSKDKDALQNLTKGGA